MPPRPEGACGQSVRASRVSFRKSAGREPGRQGPSVASHRESVPNQAQRCMPSFAREGRAHPAPSAVAPGASMVPAAQRHRLRWGGVRHRRRRCHPRHHCLSTGVASIDGRRYGCAPWARRAPSDHPGSRPSESQGLSVLECHRSHTGAAVQTEGLPLVARWAGCTATRTPIYLCAPVQAGGGCARGFCLTWPLSHSILTLLSSSRMSWQTAATGVP